MYDVLIRDATILGGSRRLVRAQRERLGAQAGRQAFRPNLDPFGRGKALGGSVGGVAYAIIGGWQLNAIMSYQSGTPSEINQNNSSPLFASRQVPNILSSNTDGRGGNFDPARDKALNIGAFGKVGPFEFANGTIFVGSARNFSIFNEDFGVMKRAYATEDINVELRFEVFNAFNRVVFGGAAGNVSNPASFGTVGGQGNPPRSGQLALKINF